MFTQIELYKTRRFSVPRHFNQPLFWLCISIVYAALSLVLCDVIAKVKPGVDVFTICNLVFCFIAFLLCVNILNILFVLMGVALMLCIAPAIDVLNFLVDYIAPLSLYVFFQFVSYNCYLDYGLTFFHTHLLLLFETNEGTYWSFEQIRPSSNHLNNNYVIVIQRAMNKGILLKERQRNARDPLFTNVLHLDSAATAVKQNMIAVLEFIWKKDHLDSLNFLFSATHSPTTNLASIMYHKFKDVPLSSLKVE